MHRRYFTGALIGGLLGFTGFARASDNGSPETNGIAPGPLRLMQPWSTTEDVQLDARVNAKSTEVGWGVLSILRSGEPIYTLDPKTLYAVSLLVLDDGNLGTLWAEGLGNDRHLFVFAYSNGKVRQVLHTVSNGLGPEFVYQTHGHVMCNRAEIGSSCLQQRIIIPNTNWILAHKGQKSELLPVSADIYNWDEKSCQYKVRKKVPWSQRLTAL